MADDTQLAPLDLQARLREKVREELGKLIPDEVLDRFVARAWQELTEGTSRQCERGHPPARGGYQLQRGECEDGHKLFDREPELFVMIKTELRTALLARVKEWTDAQRTSGALDGAARSALEAAGEVAGKAFLETVRREATQMALGALVGALGRCPNGHAGIKGANCGCGLWIPT